MPVTAACTNEQKVPVTANPVTASGAPAQLDGGLQGSVISGDGSYQPHPADPNSGYLVSGSGVGPTVYRLFGDADLGAGQVVIEDSGTLEVSGAQAVSFGLTAGVPEPK